MGAVNALVTGGYAPLSAMILASRGMNNAAAADSFLSCNDPLPDPFLLKDMDKAVARIRRALANQELICAYGDHDVDGITSTTLLTQCFTAWGGRVLPYIPDRLEEGYGLNLEAVELLAQEGVIAIPRTGKAKHAEENAAAAAIQLTAEDLTTLNAAFPAPRRREPLDIM